MNVLDLIDETAYETEAEREERESVQFGFEFHPGYFADLAAFEGMGR